MQFQPPQQQQEQQLSDLVKQQNFAALRSLLENGISADELFLALLTYLPGSSSSSSDCFNFFRDLIEVHGVDFNIGQVTQLPSSIYRIDIVCFINYRLLGGQCGTFHESLISVLFHKKVDFAWINLALQHGVAAKISTAAFVLFDVRIRHFQAAFPGNFAQIQISFSTFSTQFVHRHHHASLKWLIQHSTVDVNEVSGELAMPPLSYALRTSCQSMAKALLAHPSIDLHCLHLPFKKTPLYQAMTVCGDGSMVKLLLQHPGFDVHKVSSNYMLFSEADC